MTEHSKPSLTLQEVGQLTGFLVTFGFLISLIYDWGFLNSLGIEYRHIPSSIADHFRTGLVWFPPLVGCYIVFLAWEFQIQRMEKGLTESEIENSSKDPQKTRRLRAQPFKFFVWICILMTFSYLLLGDTTSSVPAFAFFVIWVVFAQWCYSTPLIQLRRNKWVQVSFTYLPAAAILAYSAGYSAGTNAAYRHKDNITINMNGKSKEIEGAYLRSYESGLLYLSKDDKPTFILWNSISSYSFETRYGPYKGILCSWFDHCPTAPKIGSGTGRSSHKDN